MMARIKPILSGHPPEVQGAVLADLVAIWLAGHRPDYRKIAFEMWLEVLPKLIEVNEKIIFGEGGWREI